MICSLQPRTLLLLGVIYLALVCSACPLKTSSTIQPTRPTTPSQRVTLQEARDLLERGEIRQALSLLEDLNDEDKDPAERREALFLLSTLPNLSLSTRLTHLHTLTRLELSPEMTRAAQAQRALIAYEQGDTTQALDTLRDFSPNSPPTLLLPKDHAQFALLLATSRLSQNNSLPTLRSLQSLHELSPKARSFALSKAYEQAQTHAEEASRLRDEKGIFLAFFGHVAHICHQMTQARFSLDSVQPSLLYLAEHSPSLQATHISNQLALLVHSKIPAAPPLVGALLPLTGSRSALGRRAFHGLTSALAATRAATPHQTSALVILFDTQSDPQRALEGVRTLHQTGVVAILGPLSEDTAQTIAPLVATLQLPTLALGIHTRPQQPSPWLFRRPALLDLEVQTLAAWMKSKNLRRLAILAPDVPLSKTLYETMRTHTKRLGIEIVTMQSFAPSATDLRAQARAVKRSKADAVFIPTVASKLPLVTSFLAQEDLWCNPAQSPSIHCLGNTLWMEGDPLAVEPQNLQGAIVALSYAPFHRSPENNAFTRALRDSTNTSPDLFSASTFEALRLLALPSAQGASLSARRTALRTKLQTLQRAPSLSGPIHTTPTGVLTHQPLLFRVSGSSWDALPTP